MTTIIGTVNNFYGHVVTASRTKKLRKKLFTKKFFKPNLPAVKKRVLWHIYCIATCNMATILTIHTHTNAHQIPHIRRVCRKYFWEILWNNFYNIFLSRQLLIIFWYKIYFCKKQRYSPIFCIIEKIISLKFQGF